MIASIKNTFFVKSTCFLLLLMSIIPRAHAQTYEQQQRQIFAVNIISNGLISGISGAIHKKKHEKLLPVFTKNFAKGCLGGFVKYLAKKETYHFRNNDRNYLLPFNRAFFFLGHSITMNASMNKKTFENYFCNFYGVDMRYQPYLEKGNRFSAKPSLGTLYSMARFINDGHKLDFKKSLIYGQYYFDLNPDTRNSIDGLALFNVFAIRKYPNGNTEQSLVPHEIVHTYQAYDYFALSSPYQSTLEKSLKSYRIYNAVDKYFSMDYQFLFYSTLYSIQPTPIYYQNYFEFEAEHFSLRRYLDR